MSSESIQHKLDRVRSPRVHLTYDLEKGDAIVKKELEFVVGVMSDLSGMPEKPLPKLKDRKFVVIDRDNINEVFKAMEPRLAYRVDNKLDAAGNTKLGVELRFKSLEDFSPESVVKQVAPLRGLLEARQRLSELLSKMDVNDQLGELLWEVARNTDKLNKLAGEVKSAGEKPSQN